MAEVERIGVTGDSIVWSVKRGGVHRVHASLSGIDGPFMGAAYDPVTGRFGERAPSGAGGMGIGVSSPPTTIVYWDEQQEYYEECTTKGETRSCATKTRNGGTELTVLNLAAVTAGS